jgi:predicted DNA-binding protein
MILVRTGQVRGHCTSQPRQCLGPMNTSPGQSSACPRDLARGNASTLSTMSLTQRIELRVDDAFVESLTKLASRLGKSRAEVIRDALNYYSNDVYEWDKTHAASTDHKDSASMPSAKSEPCLA